MDGVPAPVNVPQRPRPYGVLIILALILVLVGAGVWYVRSYGIPFLFQPQTAWDASHTAVIAYEGASETVWYRGTTDGSFVKQPPLPTGVTVTDIGSNGTNTYVLAENAGSLEVDELVDGAYVRRGVLPAPAYGLTTSPDGSFVGVLTQDTNGTHAMVMDRAGQKTVLGVGRTMRFISLSGDTVALVVEGTHVTGYPYENGRWGSGVVVAEAPEPLTGGIAVGLNAYAVSGISGTVYTSALTSLRETELAKQDAPEHMTLEYIDATLYAFSLTPSPTRSAPDIVVIPLDGSASYTVHIPASIEHPHAIDPLT